MYREVTIIALGDVPSKKKELLIKYTLNKKFYQDSMPNVFNDNVREIIVDYIPYSVHFIDVECDDDYEISRRRAYSEASMVLLCYSIANRKSFNNAVKKWCVEVRKARPNIPMVLVATDTEVRGIKPKDSSHKKYVTTAEGENMKFAINACAFVECSVEKLVGIDDVFIEAIRSLYCNTVDYNAFYHNKYPTAPVKKKKKSF